MSGFTDVNLTVDGAVLDAASSARFISRKSQRRVASEQEHVWVHVALHVPASRSPEATNTTHGNADLTLDSCIEWGDGYECSLSAAITQILASIGTMQQTLHKLVAMPEAQPCSVLHFLQARMTSLSRLTHVGWMLLRWFTLELWHTVTQKKQAVWASRSEKACINVMMVTGGRDMNIPAAPVERTEVAYRMWKQTLRTLAKTWTRRPIAS
ncbi:hypothetical protein GN958_ATG19805 [Phytophthora infestans]|uniref:Uncharacterized protein n=1 Tax=Phytophthora infestans TaxID=4787 RepID=A0A8S9TQV1_PHYIN|nr:hypothetical protein GN958_ATG19805 [Phytophthora infestans]